MPDTGPAPRMRWYERWIPIYMMHMQGQQLTWPTHVYMQTMRAIHFVFFRKATRAAQRKYRTDLSTSVVVDTYKKRSENFAVAGTQGSTVIYG